jgi:hypothetical protein
MIFLILWSVCFTANYVIFYLRLFVRTEELNLVKKKLSKM